MSKTFVLLAGAALVALGSAASAQEAPGQRGQRNADVTRAQVVERVTQRFQRLDADRDGRVTPEEMRQARAALRERMQQRRFDRLDLNHDGSITREEMAQAHAQMRERREAARARRGAAAEGAHRRGHHRFAMRHHRGHGRMGGFGQRMFGEQGYVTLEQMRERALQRFDRLDANRDGTVTAEERRQARAQMRERMRQRRARTQQQQPSQQGEAPQRSQ